MKFGLIDGHEIIQTRARAYTGSIASLSDIEAAIKALNRKVRAPTTRFQIWRSWLGGWVTQRRLHLDARSCCFLGCANAQDLDEHYLDCPRLWLVIRQCTSSPAPCSSPLGRLALAPGMLEESRLQAMKQLAVATALYNALRTKPSLMAEVCRAHASRNLRRLWHAVVPVATDQTFTHGNRELAKNPRVAERPFIASRNPAISEFNLNDFKIHSLAHAISFVQIHFFDLFLLEMLRIVMWCFQCQVPCLLQNLCSFSALRSLERVCDTPRCASSLSLLVRRALVSFCRFRVFSSWRWRSGCAFRVCAPFWRWRSGRALCWFFPGSILRSGGGTLCLILLVLCARYHSMHASCIVFPLLMCCCGWRCIRKHKGSPIPQGHRLIGPREMHVLLNIVQILFAGLRIFAAIATELLNNVQIFVAGLVIFAGIATDLLNNVQICSLDCAFCCRNRHGVLHDLFFCTCACTRIALMICNFHGIHGSCMFSPLLMCCCGWRCILRYKEIYDCCMMFDSLIICRCRGMHAPCMCSLC